MSVDAGSIYSDVRVRLDKLTGDITGIKAQFDRIPKAAQDAQAQTDTAGKNMEGSFKSLNLAAAGAMLGITIAIKSVVSTFSGFEQSMANTRSVTGATAEEFAAMTAKAEEMGKTTRFTASKAGDAMYYLASAGMNAQQVMSSLDGVMMLAGATQSDLASTSATVAATLSQFSLQASDSTKVANVFAAAITSSQATMDKLSESMKYVGPISGGMGKSLEETTAALDALFNAGFQASQAGTTLREILGYLSDSAGPVVKKLNEMGVSFEQVNPQIHSMADIVDTLNKAGLTAADAMSIFGQRAGPGLQVLLKTGGDELRAMQETITGTNKASEAYATQLDTLSGGMDIMKSAAQEAAITFGKAFEPALRAGLQVLTALFNVVSDMPTPLKILVGSVVAVTTALTAASTATRLLNIAIETGPLLAVGALATGVVALTVGVSNLVSKAQTSRVNDLFSQVKDDLVDSVQAGDDVATAIKNVSDETGVSVSKVAELAKQAGIVSDEMQKQVDAMVQANAERDKAAASDKEIANQNEQIKNLLGAAANSGTNMADAVKRFADQNGIAYERVLAIARTLKNLTPIQENQLEKLKGQLDYLSAASDERKLHIELGKQLGQTIADNTKKQEAQTKAIESAAAAEALRVNKVEKLRDAAYAKYLQQERDVKDEIESRLITQEQGNAELIKDNKALITTLENLGYTSQKYGAVGWSMIEGAIARMKQLTGATDDQVTAYGWMGSEYQSMRDAQVTSSRNFHDEESALQKREAEEFQATMDAEVAAQKKADADKKASAQDAANIIGSALGQILDQMNSDIQNGTLTWEEFGKTVLKVLSSTLQGLADRLFADAALAIIETSLGLVWEGVGAGEALIAGGVAEGASIALGIAAANMETGGIVLPTGGGTIVRAAENGYPELMLNSGPSGQPEMAAFASQIAAMINKSNSGGGTLHAQFVVDGKVQAEGVARYINNGIVRVVLK